MEDDTLNRIISIENEIKKLNDQKNKISNRIRILQSEKEDLESTYRRNNIRNQTDVSKWTQNTFDWSNKVLTILQERFNFKTFRFKQLAAINATLSKRDVLLLMPTGGGKSLVYQLPALVTKKLTLVVSPLISLIEDQLHALKKLKIEAATLNGQSSKDEKKRINKAITDPNSGLNLLYVTPEWVAKSKLFMTHLQKGYDNGNLARVVIDEVHCCSTWGHDFRPDYNTLGFFKTMFPDVPILGLTATATMKVLSDIQKSLCLSQDAVIITAPFNRPNLYYSVIEKDNSKEKCINYIAKKLQKDYAGKSGIIYCGTIKECEDLTLELRSRSISVNHYHASMEPEDKTKVYKRWVENKYQAVIATIAFGMGIDKPDVKFVIHYAVPKSMEGLYQESGRAGRDGQKADCIIMYNLQDYLRNVAIANSITDRDNCSVVLDYVLEKQRCRRLMIAEHFEDMFKTECSKMCDNCNSPNASTQAFFTYDISPAFRDIKTIIDEQGEEGNKVTLNKIITSWFKNTKKSKVEKATCTNRQGEDIIAHLINKGYLTIEKGYTMYTTVSYLKYDPRKNDTEKILFSCTEKLSGYKKVQNVAPNDEPSAKRLKTDEVIII